MSNLFSKHFVVNISVRINMNEAYRPMLLRHCTQYWQDDLSQMALHGWPYCTVASLRILPSPAEDQSDTRGATSLINVPSASAVLPARGIAFPDNGALNVEKDTLPAQELRLKRQTREHNIATDEFSS
eukprot:g3811.t1